MTTIDTAPFRCIAEGYGRPLALSAGETPDQPTETAIAGAGRIVEEVMGQPRNRVYHAREIVRLLEA
jgi:hypothetical protein